MIVWIIVEIAPAKCIGGWDHARDQITELADELKLPAEGRATRLGAPA